MMFVTWALGCGGPRAPVVDPPPFETLAHRAGYVVQQGELEFMQPEDCCAEGVSCLLNNPSTPYGSYRLPPAPDQGIDNPPSWPTHHLYYLRPDEAVVFLGRTPPSAGYFSFRNYLWARGQAPIPAFGSLGSTVNPIVVAAALEDQPFDQPFALITSADAAVEAEVRGMLIAAGWAPEHIHRDPIPTGDSDLALSPGVTIDHDSYSTIVRIAVYDDPVAGAAYQADPGQLLRLSPGTPQPLSDPHPAQPLPVEGSGADELDRAAAVDTLAAAILDAYPAHVGYDEPSSELMVNTYDCILNVGSCLGEISDAYYAVMPDFLLPTSDVFVVAYGVNHHRTGRASYMNLSIADLNQANGVDAITNVDLPGSADPWLADVDFAALHPDVDPDDLYAWIISRDCDLPAHEGRPCMEIPTTCPGVGTWSPMLLGFRAYLDPVSGARPDGRELVADRAVAFVPRLGGGTRRASPWGDVSPRP